MQEYARSSLRKDVKRELGDYSTELAFDVICMHIELHELDKARQGNLMGTWWAIFIILSTSIMQNRKLLLLFTL